MSESDRNPALEAFLKAMGEECLLAEVWVHRTDRGFELRHARDRGSPPGELEAVSLERLRNIAQFTTEGAFRPLKSAPNLGSGWRLWVTTCQELDRALETLYPGAIADWYASQSGGVATPFREFTERQTGMYRVTHKLNDAQARDAIAACCHRRHCLKRRLWTVEGLPTDAPAEKSVIPCLEPCAVLLEFARIAIRIEQKAPVTVKLSKRESRLLERALEQALDHPDPHVREGDVSAPGNPRRLQLTLRKLRSIAPAPAGEAAPRLYPKDIETFRAALKRSFDRGEPHPGPDGSGAGSPPQILLEKLEQAVQSPSAEDWEEKE